MVARMAVYHVFVEGSAEGTPEGIERLAAAIAQHYGLPVAELRVRLAKGRFRVKGNCDRDTAESYARDLAKLGARCAIEDTDAAPARTSSPSLPPRAQNSSLPPRTTAPAARPSGNFQSGLSAAFSGDAPAASLGALADDAGMLKLASVDGADEPAPPPPAAVFDPPPTVARTATKPKAAAAPPQPPVDMFAPPDAEAEAAFKVELADDEVERSAKKRATTPPVNEPAPEPPARISRPSIQAQEALVSPRGLADPNTRFALGVLIAIVVGFIPAHAIASLREHAAYGEIDQLVDKTQHEADTQDGYDALDAFRAHELARKYDARHNAELLAFLIWAAAGAGIAYVWFRRIRWPDAV
jgi:hypothetical protein